MPKIKTSELTGLALDWAVAKVEGCRWADTTNNPLSFKHTQKLIPHYSTDWSQGGPIIGREGIATRRHSNGTWYAMQSSKLGDGQRGQWAEFDWINTTAAEPAPRRVRFDGPTQLIAAMRCFVASKLGDEVDVPEELL